MVQTQCACPGIDTGLSATGPTIPHEARARVLAHCERVEFPSELGNDLCKCEYPVSSNSHDSMSKKYIIEAVVACWEFCEMLF